MATGSMSTIASEVQRCLNLFACLCNSIEHRNIQLEDQFGRFRVWVGTFTARGPAHSPKSLDYRLRDSTDVRRTVLSLLQDLQRALGGEELDHVVGLPRVVQDQDLGPNGTSGSTPELSLHSESFTISESDSDSDNEAGVPATQEVHDVVDCLMRFSLALRRPAQQDLARLRLSTTTTTFESYYTERVAMIFPRAPLSIQQRIGKTMSANRQYLTCREAYRKRLDAYLEGDTHVSGERQRMVATSLHGTTTEAMSSTARDIASLSDASTASDTDSDDETRPLRFPQWPAKGVFGQPFECPLCFGTIVTPAKRSWKQHVLEDIPPYVCLELDCPAISRPFCRRRDWRHHAISHKKLWVCPLSCDGAKGWPSIDSLEVHLRAEHGPAMRMIPLEACSRDDSQSTSESATESCPLCQQEGMTESVYYKHVCRHLEELALFIVPAALADSNKTGTSTSSVVRHTLDGASSVEMRRADAGHGNAGPVFPSTSIRGQQNILGEDQQMDHFYLEDLIHSIVREVTHQYIIYTIGQQVTEQVLKQLNSLSGSSTQGQGIATDTRKQQDTLYLDRLIASSVDESMRRARNEPHYPSLVRQSWSYTFIRPDPRYSERSLPHPRKPVVHHDKPASPDPTMDSSGRAAPAKARGGKPPSTGPSGDELREYQEGPSAIGRHWRFLSDKR